MDSSSFDLANGSHWLLVSSFVVVSVTGLAVSWQWFQEAKSRRRRLRLSRRLMREVHSKAFPSRTFDSQRRYGDSLPTTDRMASLRNGNPTEPLRFDD